MDNKNLLERVATDLDLPLEKVQEIEDALCGVISESLLDGDAVALPSFGNFETKKRNERISVHPASGRRMLIPPKLVVNFRPSAILKNRLR